MANHFNPAEPRDARGRWTKGARVRITRPNWNNPANGQRATVVGHSKDGSMVRVKADNRRDAISVHPDHLTAVPREAGTARDRAKALLRRPHFDAATSTAGLRGKGVGTGTLDDPINCAGNVVLAAKLLSEGKHIRLNKEAEVGTLLDRLAYLTNEAARKGEKAPNIDLCKVSVPKTNLFCAKSKGIPRAQMPQLGGEPIKGSKADALPRVRGNEVDILNQFRDALRAKGIAVTYKDMRADHLKATQKELIGPKVAGIYETMKQVPSSSTLFEPLFVTRDGYIIDGHHRWAAEVALESTKGTPADKRMVHVAMVDMEIGAALDVARAFAHDWGIPQEGFKVSKKDLQGVATMQDLSNIDLTRHVASEKGVERYHLPVGTPLGGKHGPETSRGAAYAQRLRESERYKRVDAQAKIAEQYAKDHPVHTDVKPKDGWPPNPETVRLNHKDMPLDKAVKIVSDAYGWADRDQTEGLGFPHERQSVREQDKAQIVAKVWYESTDSFAADTWTGYQMPSHYEEIQSALRDGKNGDNFTAEEMRQYVSDMFREGGYTADKPMVTYRALKSSPSEGLNWADKLKPGTVFTDTGIVSSTAHTRFAQGWLLNGPEGETGRVPQRSDVVMEIRIPKGTRICGGDPQFIETMLPPGTRLKVTDAYPLQASAIDPIHRQQQTFTYTHVIAEVVPNEAP